MQLIGAGIVQSVYGLAGGQKGSEFEVPMGSKFSLSHVVQTRFGVHPASFPTGTRAFSPKVKRPERKADHTCNSCRGQENVDHGVVFN
jgi:hypothetical protein